MYGYLFATLYPQMAEHFNVTVKVIDAEMKFSFGIETKKGLDKNTLKEYIEFVRAYAARHSCTIRERVLSEDK